MRQVTPQQRLALQAARIKVIEDKRSARQRLRLQAAKVKLLEARSSTRQQEIVAASAVITFAGMAVRWDRLTDGGRQGKVPNCLASGSISEWMIENDDVPLTIGHDARKVLARTGDGTLKLLITDIGLEWFTSVPSCAASRWLAKEITEGRLAGSSISVEGRGKTPTEKRGGVTCAVINVVDELRDVSIVGTAADLSCMAFVLSQEEIDAAQASIDAAPVERPARSRRPKRNRKQFPNGAQHLISHYKTQNNAYMTAMARQNGMTTRQLTSAVMSGSVGHSEISGGCMYEPDENESCGWRYLGPT
jgi:phage head maturation protease